jgi:hypothetical protein
MEPVNLTRAEMVISTTENGVKGVIKNVQHVQRSQENVRFATMASCSIPRL